MSKQFPETKEAWQAAIFDGMGLAVENGRFQLTNRQFPYTELSRWLNKTYHDGYHPDFVPALLRNLAGLVAWLYGNGGEPNWSKSDAEQQTYRHSLPTKRMGAGALFWDEYGRILLVEPSYKPTWEIPGGVVERNESPLACCQREVFEELGLELKIGRLLIVDYNAPTDAKSESLMFIFQGGKLTPDTISTIQLQSEELLSYQFFAPDQLPEALTLSLKQRILAAWQQQKTNENSYREE